MSRSQRRAMIDREEPKLSLVRQCALLGISRSSLYYLPTEAGAEDLELMALIDQQYLKTPFYGSRRMTAWLSNHGHQVNRKRVRRLMQLIGLEAIYRRPNTSKPNPGHKVYPYLDFSRVAAIVEEIKPDVVVNCIGNIKQLPTAKDPIVAIEVNSLFPHHLARLCNTAGIRLIHMSPDCVFSGKKGCYTEEDAPDPEDLYGRSKLLGEVCTGGSLTLRTSMIGRELDSQRGLLEWFLAQEGKRVQGYVNAIFSGITTLTLDRVLGDIIDADEELSGLYHLSSEAISKHYLLVKLQEYFGLHIEIEPYEEYHCDRSLDSTRLRTLTGFTPPAWEQMIEELVPEDLLYRRWRHDGGS